jgi:predicted phosphodiesterase
MIHKRIQTPDRVIRFGIVSDTHLGTESEDLEHLHEMYDIFKREGITRVFHSGDLTDGNGVYMGQENDLKVIGTERQAEYFNRNYPKIEGIETMVITGNHDLKAYRRSGIDVGNLIVHGGAIPKDGSEKQDFEGRKDIIYLGRYYARVKWNNVNIDLAHPDYGFAYAISYSPQKYINELEGGQKPDILLFGHLHRMMYMVYRNIHLFMCGAFQKQNDYLKRKGIQPVRGGWIVELNLDRHRALKKIKPQAFQFVL